jgi:hypothetical protein
MVGLVHFNQLILLAVVLVLHLQKLYAKSKLSLARLIKI